MKMFGAAATAVALEKTLSGVLEKVAAPDNHSTEPQRAEMADMVAEAYESRDNLKPFLEEFADIAKKAEDDYLPPKNLAIAGTSTNLESLRALLIRTGMDIQRMEQDIQKVETSAQQDDFASCLRFKRALDDHSASVATIAGAVLTNPFYLEYRLRVRHKISSEL